MSYPARTVERRDGYPVAVPERLGCGINEAVLVDTLTDNAWSLGTAGKVRYTARLDGPGDATIVVPKQYLADQVCADPAGLAESWGYQIEILRRLPGAQPELVFAGPVSGWGETAGATTIHADDVLGWFTLPKARTRAMHNDDGSVIVQTVLLDAVAHRRTYIDRWVTWDMEGSSVGATVIIDGAKRRDVMDVLRDVLATTTDLTAKGRRIVIRGQRNQAVTFTLEDRHFIQELRTWEDGRQFADIVYVLGANGVQGQFPLPGATFTPRSPIPVEHALERNNLRTVDDCNRAAFNEWTQRSGLAVQVDVPSSGRLSPEAPVALSSLVPGTLAAVRLANRQHPLVATMKLTEVTVTQGSADGAPRANDGTFVSTANGNDETVSVSLTPMNVAMVNE